VNLIVESCLRLEKRDLYFFSIAVCHSWSALEDLEVRAITCIGRFSNKIFNFILHRRYMKHLLRRFSIFLWVISTAFYTASVNHSRALCMHSFLEILSHFRKCVHDQVKEYFSSSSDMLLSIQCSSMAKSTYIVHNSDRVLVEPTLLRFSFSNLHAHFIAIKRLHHVSIRTIDKS
jgi:hypothetical protein